MKDTISFGGLPTEIPPRGRLKLNVPDNMIPGLIIVNGYCLGIPGEVVLAQWDEWKDLPLEKARTKTRESFKLSGLAQDIRIVILNNSDDPIRVTNVTCETQNPNHDLDIPAYLESFSAIENVMTTKTFIGYQPFSGYSYDIQVAERHDGMKSNYFLRIQCENGKSAESQDIYSQLEEALQEFPWDELYKKADEYPGGDIHGVLDGFSS